MSRILDDCFKSDGFGEIDDFELNDDDFDFGESPSPKLKAEKKLSNKKPVV